MNIPRAVVSVSWRLIAVVEKVKVRVFSQVGPQPICLQSNIFASPLKLACFKMCNFCFEGKSLPFPVTLFQAALPLGQQLATIFRQTWKNEMQPASKQSNHQEVFDTAPSLQPISSERETETSRNHCQPFGYINFILGERLLYRSTSDQHSIAQ